MRIYPPIAIDTEEAAAARAETFVSNVERFLDGTPQNIVSASSNA